METHMHVSAHMFKDAKQNFLRYYQFSKYTFQKNKFSIVLVLICFVAFEWLQNRCPGSGTKCTVITCVL